MPFASPALIRAARALLDWTMVDLADHAGVSISTVKRFEDGKGAPASVGLMQDALERAGIRFLPDDGYGPGVRHAPRSSSYTARANIAAAMK